MIRGKNISKIFERNIPRDKKEKRSREKKTKEEFYAVNKVDFVAENGEILGILGPNGAEKTTLLRIIGNIMSPSEGTVEISTKTGEIAPDAKTARENIGYLSANTKLFKRITPRETLALLGQLYDFDKKKSEERAAEIIELLDMRSFADNQIDRLSTGQLQRTNIARCLMHDPLNYILDEPTLGLDVISSRSIIEFMKQEKNRGKTILYSTHYMEEAEFLCDRILMLHKGEVIAYGTPNEINSLADSTNLRDAFIRLSEKMEATHE